MLHSFGPAFTMPRFDNIYAAFSVGYWISSWFMKTILTSPTSTPTFIYSAELSFNNNIRGGHIYNSWLTWWFLAEFAEKRTEGFYNGLLHTIRLLVEAENMDFGDVWGSFVAHYQTWDFGSIGSDMASREVEHLSAMKLDKYVQPPIPDSITPEGRKTTVEVELNKWYEWCIGRRSLGATARSVWLELPDSSRCAGDESICCCDHYLG